VREPAGPQRTPLSELEGPVSSYSSKVPRSTSIWLARLMFTSHKAWRQEAAIQLVTQRVGPRAVEVLPMSALAEGWVKVIEQGHEKPREIEGARSR